MNGAAMKTWSSTQSTIALSSGEAELTALVKAAIEGIAVQSSARDMRLHVSPLLVVDSSVAVGMAGRLGVGRVRHLDVKDLWVQERLKRHAFVVSRVPSEADPADVGTKPLTAGELQGKLEAVDAQVVARRPRWADMCA